MFWKPTLQLFLGKVWPVHSSLTLTWESSKRSVTKKLFNNMVLKAFPKTIPWNHKKQKIYHFSGPLFWYAITHTQVWWNCTQAYLHKQHLIFPNFYKKLGWNLKKFLSQQQNSTYNDTNLSIDCQTSRISQKCLNRFYRNSDKYFDTLYIVYPFLLPFIKIVGLV